jgi:YidC/Oxa1 family membrane protein insertase
MIGALFEIVAKPMEWVYGFTSSYILAISFMALIVIIITAPLVLKQTKGMLEMQKLAPEMRRLQNEFRGDRQKLNEEMMKLYQSHKVNPLASCFPILLQLPVFIIMFRILHGLTYIPSGAEGFAPKYISPSSQMYQDLVGQTKMMSFGLDLAARPIDQMAEGFGTGWPYALLVIGLGLLYLAQQKMVAARATVSPTMSQTQQKIFQYLPVVFAIFLIFYLTGLVVYYAAQAIFRIGLQYYITHRFYKGDESLGKQAMAASEKAREMSKTDGGPTGLFAQAKRDLSAGKDTKPAPATTTTSKRVTPPKNRPTPSSKSGRPAPTGKSTRPGGTSNKK